MIWLLTCEHYGNRVPFEFQHLFVKADDVLASHRGFDLHAASLFHTLEPQFDAAYYFEWSRLLIEPNRSLHHRHLFSPFSMHLTKGDRMKLIADYYYPYRSRVEDFIRSCGSEQVMHISAHTFTPKLGQEVRNAEVGILFDPKRSGEKEFAVLLKKSINNKCASNVRFNYPYRGVADGFTTYLRKVFPFNYCGLELEVRNNNVAQHEQLIMESIRELRAVLD